MVDKEHSMIFLGIGIGALVLALLFIPISQSAPSHATDVSNDQPPIFINGGFSGSRIMCNYYVYNDTTTNLINAKNCFTGAIDYSGSDSYTVIQSAQNHITHGGILYIGNGTFYLTKQLRLNMSSVEVIGFSNGIAFLHGVTILKQKAGMNMNTSLVFIIGGSSATANNDQLRDLLVDCNSANNPKGTLGEGVYDQGSYNFGMQNVGVLNCKYKSVILQDSVAGYYKNIYSEAGNSTGFTIFSTSPGNTENNVFDTLFSDNFNQGISFDIEGNVHDNEFIGLASQNDKSIGFYMAWDGTTSPKQNIITGLVLLQVGGTGTSGTTGIRLDGSSYNSFLGCSITNWGQASTNTYDGIQLNVLSNQNSTHNTFIGCVITDTATNKMKYAIEEVNSGQNFNVFKDTQIQGTFGTGTIKTLGPNSIARDNTGYNPVASSTVTAGASVWTYTNKDAYYEQMILSTVNGQTAETCQGVAVISPTSIGQMCLLDVGQSMTATWTTTAPIYTKVPMD